MAAMSAGSEGSRLSKEGSQALRRRLARRLGRHRRRAAPAREREASARPLPADLLTRESSRGCCAECVRTYGLEEEHAGIALGALAGVACEDLARHAFDPDLRALDPLRAAYLDIETTSLSAGAGARVFLVGIGLFEQGLFAVHQVFQRGPTDELAMLERVAELLGGRSGLVTFHGKSFDRHRLHERLLACGLESPLLTMAHLDLFHVGRRLFGGRLRSLRLQAFEREILGFERVDDLPGADCPAAWFAHVRGEPSRIGDVFEHNLLDVLTLVALTCVCGRRPQKGAEAAALLNYARGLLAEGSADGAERYLRWALEGGEGTPAQGRARRELSLLLRRTQRCAEAAQLWRESAEQGDVWAMIELAKHLEHRQRRYGEALEWVGRALEWAAREDSRRGWGEALEHRQRRLERLLARRDRRASRS